MNLCKTPVAAVSDRRIIAEPKDSAVGDRRYSAANGLRKDFFHSHKIISMIL